MTTYTITQEQYAELLSHADLPWLGYLTPNSGEAVACGLCGEVKPFSGSCGGGKSNPKALCYTAPSTKPADGWKLVPIEPTDEMINAGRIAPCTADEMDADDDYRDVYKAMLSAAPQGKTNGLD